jgi:hypothetical protein
MTSYQLYVVKVHQDEIAREVRQARMPRALRKNRRSTLLAKRVHSILTAVK